MAVAYVSDVDKTPATGSSFTYTSFAVSGANPVIIVIIALSSTTATISSVACSAGLSSGTPVEITTRRQTGTSTYVSIWAIPAPSGTGTITVTLSASVAWQSNAILFSGADQTTPCPTGDAVTAGGAGVTLTVTPTNLTSNDAACGGGANTAGSDAPRFNQTETFNNNSTTVNLAAGYHLGTGAISVTWGADNTGDALVGVRIVAAGAAGSRGLFRPPNLTTGAGGSFFPNPVT